MGAHEKDRSCLVEKKQVHLIPLGCSSATKLHTSYLLSTHYQNEIPIFIRAPDFIFKSNKRKKFP
jgi:hypothetical protein